MSRDHALVVPSESGYSDSVAEAEALAKVHLAREAEVERVAKIVRWLDNLVKIPGTRVGFGLDAILGLVIPGVGDVMTGIVGMTVIGAAIRRGVPKIVIARMLFNLGLDIAIGIIPVVGDLFDLWWRANTSNLARLERYQGELEPRARPSDYVVVGGMVAGIVSLFSLPWIAIVMVWRAW